MVRDGKERFRVILDETPFASGLVHGGYRADWFSLELYRHGYHVRPVTGLNARHGAAPHFIFTQAVGYINLSCSHDVPGDALVHAHALAYELFGHRPLDYLEDKLFFGLIEKVKSSALRLHGL